MFKTRYTAKDFKKKYDRTGGEKMVETAGYISARQRIENMINAGQRLVDYRASQYDIDGEKFDPENDETPMDPTRRKNFDLAEATQLSLDVDKRLRKQKKKAEEDALKEGQPQQSEKIVEAKGGGDSKMNILEKIRYMVYLI